MKLFSGCLGSSDESKVASNEIDKNIKSWIKAYENSIKVLLLGTGEAGKTTVLKQMKILHIQGFNNEERLERAIQIKHNIHESIIDLADNLEPLGLTASQETLKAASIVKRVGPIFTDEYFDLVEAIWNDPAIKECLRRSNEFQLIDCAEYFLTRLDKVKNHQYIPDDADILQCRQKTTGIQKIEFIAQVSKVKKGFWLFDVGGQRGERKKWIQVFEGIHAVWFLVASSDFDQTLREDSSQNRLQEALTLFEDVWRSRFLLDAGLIVFLNKQDILEKKVKEGRCIGDYFPEYHQFMVDGKSKQDEYTRTKMFIKNLIVKITQIKPSDSLATLSGIRLEVGRPRECYYHFTVATDTNNIKTVFNDIANNILIQNLSGLGII